MQQPTLKLYHLLIPVFLISILFLKGVQKEQTIKKISKDTPVLGCAIPVAGRCTGSAYCTACKNCSSCKHCNSGGSCGVCANGYKAPRRRRRTTTKTIRRKTVSKQNIFDGRNTSGYNSLSNTNTASTKQVEEPYYLQTLIVKGSNTPLNNGAAFTYKTIQKLNKGDRLLLLSTHSEWIKVLVERTETVGYVYYNFVYLVN